MTPDDFRKLALSFPAVVESARMRHPDFHVGGEIFATLGYAHKDSAMAKLTRQDQKDFVRTNPGIFKAAKAAWGGKEAQISVYRPQTSRSYAEALVAAWRNTAPKRLSRNC